MKLATLVYVRSGGQTLMLHRVKKARDIHEGKWNGLGGKFEAGETPEACAVREVFEESGLTIVEPQWRGLLTFPSFALDEDWYAFVFVARAFSGTLIDSAEGRLAWVPDASIASLPLWSGDRIFLPWLDEAVTFSGRFAYREGALHEWSVTFYGMGGFVVETLAGTGVEPVEALPAFAAAADFERPAPAPLVAPSRAPARTEPPERDPGREESACSVCGGPTERRSNKFFCHTCGFVRDRSDP